MTEYWIDKDGNGDETLWRDDGRIFEPVNAESVIRRSDLSDAADLLWPILTGVLTEDDDTVETVARAIREADTDITHHVVWLDEREERYYSGLSRAALRALRGELS